MARPAALFILLPLVGVGVHGIKNLAGLYAAEVAPTRAVGLAGGIVEVLGQLGAGVAGAPVGALAAEQGWRQVMWALAAAMAISTLLALVAAAQDADGPRRAKAS